ncbi:chitotriosidase-1-like, partial [Stegodyphus dumicola]|uniref:chitotriosidase-1-like n=1 Tax=Stegodyphus dumicola TaxID=202533 RepID=UPI0015AB9681
MKLAELFFLLYLCVPALNQLRGKGKPELLRVCYYTLFNPEPRSLNTSLCTHIIAGFASVTDGVLDLGSDANKKGYLETTSLKNVNPHLKVLITVGGGGNDDGFSNAFNSFKNRTRFISSVFSVLKKYNFDGLDVDWEFPVWNDFILKDKENFIDFLKEFKAASVLKSFVTKKTPPLLTVAVAAPTVIVEKAYDIPQMAKYVDFINLMSYDYHDYIWYTPFTGHNSPLFNRSAEKAYFATLNTVSLNYISYFFNIDLHY